MSFWRNPFAGPPKTAKPTDEELDRRWREQDRKRDQHLDRILADLQRYPDFGSVLAETSHKDGAHGR